MSGRKNSNMLAVPFAAMQLWALCGPAAADTHYVSYPGSIQAAIDASSNGDQIEVAPGTYSEAIDFKGKGVRIYSSGGSQVTTINGTGASHVVKCTSGEGPQTVLEGFTIKGGNARLDALNPSGGGILCLSSSPRIISCVIKENQATYGGGVCFWFLYPAMSNCEIWRNTADIGGGICSCYSMATLTNCTVSGNSAALNGGGLASWANGIENTPFAVNCIFWDDSPNEIAWATGDGMWAPLVNYSDVQGGWLLGLGNIDADPKFVNPGVGDLRLSSSSSPCVDAGDNSSRDPYSQDAGGNCRVWDGKDDGQAVVDMGAHEFGGVKRMFNVLRDGVPQIRYCGHIQRVIDDSKAEDKIMVPAGRYYEAINFRGKGIRVCSVDGPEVTVIDGLNSSHVIEFRNAETAATVLEGFTITGGNADGLVPDNCGGGIFCELSSPRIVNCIVCGNKAGEWGGGIYASHCNVQVIGCRIIDNEAALAGGGLYLSLFYPVIANCEILENEAPLGAGMCSFYSAPTITNCTVSGNGSPLGGYGLASWADAWENAPLITNCILWGDLPAEIIAATGEGMVQPFIQKSDVQGYYTWRSLKNIDSDPCFVDAAAGNFQPRAESPCIDSAYDYVDIDRQTPDVQPLPATDIDGNPRNFNRDRYGGAAVDMGAHEYCEARVRNKTKDLEYITIQSAIDTANNGDEIEVEPGIFWEAMDFKGKAVRLYSMKGPQVTTIDGSGHCHVVKCVSGEDPNTILDGFTITGGNANGPDYPDRSGGGMLNKGTSPTVLNCIFKGNGGYDGAGMFNNGGAPIVTGCVFTMNTADGDYGGGGMWNDNGSPVVTNCTFYGNSATVGQGGGILNIFSSNPEIVNCILWDDSPNEIKDSDVSSSSNVIYSDVEGGWAGNGAHNMDSNPLLRTVGRDDFALMPWSACIDAGRTEAVSSEAKDIVGMPRVADGDCDGTAAVDIGAYEFRHTYMGDFDSTCHVDWGDYAVLASAWLSEPLSSVWEYALDIATPGDARIDGNDLRVFMGNWLRDCDTAIDCNALRLRSTFWLDARTTAEILLGAPCACPNDVNVARILHDANFPAEDVYVWLMGVHNNNVIDAERALFNAGYPQEEYLEFTALDWVKKFSPILMFDAHYYDEGGVPMSAQTYFERMMFPMPDVPYPPYITFASLTTTDCWDWGITRVCGRDQCNCGMQNYDFSTLLTGQVPTYYKVISDVNENSPFYTGPEGRLRIEYWWFYGFQGPCNTGCPFVYCGADGTHHADWEVIMITTTPDRSQVDCVTYYQHGQWYTRRSGGFQIIGNRPVVYVGKLAHGCYHNRDHSGWMDGTPHHCCHYADYRNPTEFTVWSTTNLNLVSLRGDSESWLLADRLGTTYEYEGKEYIITPPQLHPYDWDWGPEIEYCKVGGDLCSDWQTTTGVGTHPTLEKSSFTGWTDWDKWEMLSCGGEDGCGTDNCEGLVYTQPYPRYDQGWPWAPKSAQQATGDSVASAGESLTSCGSCGAPAFSVLGHLSDNWLATP